MKNILNVQKLFFVTFFVFEWRQDTSSGHDSYLRGQLITTYVQTVWQVESVWVQGIPPTHTIHVAAVGTTLNDFGPRIEPIAARMRYVLQYFFMDMIVLVLFKFRRHGVETFAEFFYLFDLILQRLRREKKKLQMI